MNHAYERPTIVLAALLPVSFLVCFFTLGAAIDWPNSLNGSAADYLPLIAANADTVRFGYSFYFLACAMHAVLAVLLAIHLGAAARPLLAVGAVIGLVAGIFKMLGIARWLEAMPQLAATFAADPSAGSLVYEALNNYAGVTLGESLGVGLFTGLWYASLALGSGPATGAATGAGTNERVLPLWMRAYAGVAALLSLLTFSELYGNDVGALNMVGGYVQYFGYWFLAGALVLAARAAPAAAPRASAAASL